ncbi:SWI/SNF-related matrix-associated actin-dependent regulator of chromatin subfamily A containing DEAD/H box 1-like [Clavelina lepadiformis]|uniref:SWI/SNF-related matrix-associated actin-dependent regulator of chromatin subfamily A containing DEAD/H box 1 n=1 Tax=Clavelina lepadiformis TaxID=159417 RepID=A0ABP0FUB3_CLALP
MSSGKRKLSSFSSDDESDYTCQKKPKLTANGFIAGRVVGHGSDSYTNLFDESDPDETPTASTSPVIKQTRMAKRRFRFLSDDSTEEEENGEIKVIDSAKANKSSGDDTDDYSCIPDTNNKESSRVEKKNLSQLSNSSEDTVDYSTKDINVKAGNYNTVGGNVAQLSSSSDEECAEGTQTANQISNVMDYQKSKKYIIRIPKARAGPRSSVDLFKSRSSSANHGLYNKTTKKHKMKKKNMFGDSPLVIKADYDDNIEENYQEDEFASVSSDDDDEENVINEEKKKKILTLFQNGSQEELSQLSKCSTKKASLLISLRPYHSWENLLLKLDETKSLRRDLIWSCLDLLRERHTLCSLMDKCSQISKKLQAGFDRMRDQNNQSPKKSNRDIVVQQQPQNITANFQLKPYQLIGLNWMALLHRNKVNGILADEMGLGKTIQTISFLAYLADMNISDGPHVIVVPSSTIENWVREFNIWCPSQSLVLYNGSQVERKAIRQQLLSGKLHCNVVLTTYNIAVSAPEDRILFKKFSAYYAVFDEGHMLKNMSSQRFQHLMRINAEHRLLLTGTPLQNNLLELMSLLRFVMPHMFKETTSSLVSMFTHSNSENSSSFAKQRINHAKQIMQPFVLRRLKKDVLHQLPKKTETIMHCNLSQNQSLLYDKVKAKFKNQLTKQNMAKTELRNVFIELRKVANHPLLRREHYPDSKLRNMARLLKNDIRYEDSNEAYIFEDMQVMSDFELHNLCLSSRAISSFKLPDNVIMDSGKFLQLDQFLPKYKKEGKRLLIFSQFTMLMDIIAVYLKQHDHKFLRLDGQTPVSDRLNLIDNFNNDPTCFVFLLSTKAGGLGINLTSASVVILHDIDCNPYNDKQAEDRCHRVGQTKPVEVVKLIAKGTIEEDMFKCAQNKLRLEKEMTESGPSDNNVDVAALITECMK